MNTFFIRYLLFILLMNLYTACTKKETNTSILFLIDNETSQITTPGFPQDSIKINFYGKDSISILKYYNNKFLITNYFYLNDGFWERRYSGNDFGEMVRLDSILTFVNKDTSFIHTSPRELIVFVIDLSYANCKYIIQSEKNYSKTIIQSTIDTTYKDIFYYDKDFRIFKYANTFKNNIAVYLPEK